MASFREAIKVSAIDSHTYAWTSPQAGALELSATSLHFATTLHALNQPDLMTLHLTFLRRTQAGPATVRITDTKTGRQTSTVHLSLLQPEHSATDPSAQRECVVGYLTHSNLSAEKGLSLPTRWALHPAPDPADIEALSRGGDDDKFWKRQAEIPFAAFRAASTQVEFWYPRSGQRQPGMADEWMRFRSGQKFTAEAIGYVVDMFQPIAESYRSDPVFLAQTSSSPAAGGSSDGKKKNDDDDGASSLGGVAKQWYPTILLNIEVKKILPPQGVEWLFVRVRAKQIKNGRMDLEVVVLDDQGDLVAVSDHVALVVDASRNLAKRRGAAAHASDTKL